MEQVKVVLDTFVVNLGVTGSGRGGVEDCLYRVLLQAQVIVNETMGQHSKQGNWNNVVCCIAIIGYVELQDFGRQKAS
jgi:hypothetical protein